MRWLSLLSALTFSSAAFSAHAENATGVSDRSDPFVVAAENAYQCHLDAERTGDVSLYITCRSSAAISETIENLKKRGKSEADLGATLRGFSKYQTSLDGYRFVRAERKANIGRLFYRKDWKDKSLGEMNDFLGYVVRLEDGAWKVDCMINSVGTKKSVGRSGKLEERTMTDIEQHRCLSLE